MVINSLEGLQMADYFENRKQSLCNDIDDMIETADQEGYHRGYDEAWDEARDKGFDEGFDEGVSEGKRILMNQILRDIIPVSDFFPEPESQDQYEKMLNDYKEMGPMCTAVTINWLNKVLSEMDFDE